MKTNCIVNGHHTRKTAAFVRVSVKLYNYDGVVTMVIGLCCLLLYHYSFIDKHFGSTKSLSIVWQSGCC